MPVADARRSTPPLSPSEFFQPVTNDLSRRKKIKIAVKNWLNGLPVKPDEDVLRGIESEQFLAPPTEEPAEKKRKRDFLKFYKRKKKDEAPPPEVVVVSEEASEDLKKGKKGGMDEDRPPIRVIYIPAPTLTHHHLLWLHHQEHGGDKRDDLNPYNVTNRIRTSKYSLLTFLPKNLFEQFRRAANCYFLFIVILQAIPVISNYNVGLAALPLLVIVAITGAKDALEDYKRYKQDQTVNFSSCRYLKRLDLEPLPEEDEGTLTAWGRFVKRFRKQFRLDRTPLASPTGSHLPTEKHDWKRKYWQDVRVGDLVYLTNNEMIPADILILSTSEPDSACYVETKNLDGETNLKVKKGPPETNWIQTADDAAEFSGQLEVELPSSNLYNFFGRLVLPFRPDPNQACCCPADIDESESSADDEDFEAVDKEEPNVTPVNTNTLLLRGCVLRNTNYVIGVVVYTGPHTKLIMNSGGTPSKRSRIERQMNPQVLTRYYALIHAQLL